MSYFEKWLVDINEFHERKYNYENQFFLLKFFCRDKISKQEYKNKINYFFNEEFIEKIIKCDDLIFK
jgi:hypothetical protein